MNKLLPVILLTIAVAGSVHNLAAQTPSDDQIAAQFVPPQFETFRAMNHLPGDRVTWCTLPLDLDHTGRADYLAVAYGNGMIAYLRVIRRTASSSASLAAESAAATACDGPPLVSTVDLEGKGNVAIMLTCRVGNHGHEFASLFKWSAGSLTNVNPPSSRRVNGWEAIKEPNFVDLDGSGVLSILEAVGEGSVNDADVVDQIWSVYRLVGGRYAKVREGGVTYFNRYQRQTGKPRAEEEKFEAEPGQYEMTVVNGEGGQNTVSSAVITLNGATVVSPSSFSKNARVIKKDVKLVAQNVISVELRSAPGSVLHVVLSPKQ